MYKPTYIIYVETITGEVFEAFTWCRDKESGIARARQEAPEFGHNVVKIWAKPLELQE